jgi:hypothetical protein
MDGMIARRVRRYVEKGTISLDALEAGAEPVVEDSSEDRHT